MFVVPDTTQNVMIRRGGRKGETMTRRKRLRQWPPKGSYPHPAGGYITPTTRGGRIRVTGHLKAEPDLKRLAIVHHVE